MALNHHDNEIDDITDNDDDDDDDHGNIIDEENDPYLELIKFKSIRNTDGLEEAISVSWNPPHDQHHDNDNNNNNDNDNQESFESLIISTLLEPDELAPLFAGAQWAGTRVWHAAICGIQYLQQHYATILPSSSLLELGCGLGVPGMIASKYLHAQYVLLTDQESIMSQLSKNIHTNFTTRPTNNDNHDKSNNNKKKKIIEAAPLDWSCEGLQSLLQEKQHHLLHTKTFDIVLNCDCIYEPLYGKSWKYLIHVLEECLRLNPNTICLTSVERRKGDGIDQFITTLQSSPYISHMEKVFQDDPYNIEIYQAHGMIENDKRNKKI